MDISVEEKSMEERLTLARKIANESLEGTRELMYAIISIFSGDKDDLEKANSNIPANALVYIRVLLLLGREEAAINTAKGLYKPEEKGVKDEAQEVIALYLIQKGRLNEARGMLWEIDNPARKARILEKIVLCQETTIAEMSNEIADLQRSVIKTE